MNKNRTVSEIPDGLGVQNSKAVFNMNEIVGEKDILFLCYDSLRYDAAMDLQEKGQTPNINQYGRWQKRQAAGSFTYPSHHAMFAGFLPIPYECSNMLSHTPLFFPKNIGMGRKTPPASFGFEGATIMEGLTGVGYETMCIGGVAFFNKRTELGRVFPKMFQQSYWRPDFGCGVQESTKKQFDFAVAKLEKVHRETRVFLYINITAIHYPTYFYVDGMSQRQDTMESHKEALKYVDTCLPELLEAFEKRKGAFVIACSDHGTCLGEDGKIFHGINNDIVNTIPYMEFLI